MKSSGLSLIPLPLASLCLDCEMITAAHGRCVACGSSALLNVARTLSRPGRMKFLRPSADVAQIVSERPVRRGDFLDST